MDLMEASKIQLSALWHEARALIISHPLLTLSYLIPAVIILQWIGKGGSKEPPSLGGSIPIISNTYQYMTDMQGFLNRVA